MTLESEDLPEVSTRRPRGIGHGTRKIRIPCPFCVVQQKGHFLVITLRQIYFPGIILIMKTKKSSFLEAEHCGFIGAKFENLFALASGIKCSVSLNSRQSNGICPRCRRQNSALSSFPKWASSQSRYGTSQSELGTFYY